MRSRRTVFPLIFPLALVFAAALTLAACGSESGEAGSAGGEEPEPAPETTPEEPAESTSEETDETANETTEETTEEAGAAAGEGDEPLVLTLDGAPGTSFIGQCVAGSEERELQGETPESFEFPAGERLECTIGKAGDGPELLSVELTGSSDGNEVQFSNQTNARGGEVSFTYQSGSIQASSESSSSVTQSSQSSSSQSSSSQSGGSIQESTVQFGEQNQSITPDGN